MVKPRRSLHASPEFHKKLMELQRSINIDLLNQKKPTISIRDLTDELAMNGIIDLNQLTKNVLKKRIAGNDIKLRYDKRW